MPRSRSALVLLAHGARDPRWAEPLERLRERVRHGGGDVDVELAYLDHLTPDLETAVGRVAGRGAAEVTVVPVFLGLGGHVREDVPARVQSARARFPEVKISLAPSTGDDAAVIEALAAYCLRAIGC